LSDDSSIDNLFSYIKKTVNGLDILVNNAAIIHVEDFMSQSIKNWDETYAVNVRGLTRCCQEAFKLMKNNGGSIVNVSSLSGIKGVLKFSGFSSYVMSKFAVIGITEALAVEGKPYNISVNAIAPGAVDTQMLKQAAPQLKTSTLPSDIAKSIVFLADKEANKLSGSVLEIHSND
jgi:NAD(P)-dependent dehydrogenase (short-subunit alcohol dehydrogenase family)